MTFMQVLSLCRHHSAPFRGVSGSGLRKDKVAVDQQRIRPVGDFLSLGLCFECASVHLAVGWVTGCAPAL